MYKAPQLPCRPAATMVIRPWWTGCQVPKPGEGDGLSRMAFADGLGCTARAGTTSARAITLIESIGQRSISFLSSCFDRLASRFSLRVLPTFLPSRRCGDFVMVVSFVVEQGGQVCRPRMLRNTPRWSSRCARSRGSIVPGEPVWGGRRCWQRCSDESNPWDAEQHAGRTVGIRRLATLDEDVRNRSRHQVSREQGLRGGDRIVSTSSVERQKRSPVSR
jgi:hypothetical protein